MTPLTDKLRALLAERDAESIYNERMSIMNALADLIAASLAEIAAGERAKAALASIKWKSADRDNMEFSARITYSQMDKIRTALGGPDAK